MVFLFLFYLTFVMIFFRLILRDWAFINQFLPLIIYLLNQFLFINIFSYFFIITKVLKVFFLIYPMYLSLWLIILHTSFSIYYIFFLQLHLILCIKALSFMQLQFIFNIMNSYHHDINSLILILFKLILQLTFVLFKLN